MKIVKPLQLGVLHKSFTYLEKDVFAVSIPIAFSLIDGQILLEQKLWTIIGEQMEGDVFDGAMPKHVGEVLVQGDFISPNEQQVEAGSVHLKVTSFDEKGKGYTEVDKKLAVFGDRYWYKLLGAGITPSSPELFNTMPISYSNAYGGDGFGRNPTGKGYKAIDTETGERQFLPNIEYTNNLITSSSKQADSASFGRVDILWSQRINKAGTYDLNYLETIMPGLPNDVDWSYFNDAAEDQWLNSYFKGDEQFSITNMNAQYPVLKGQLPSIYGRAFINQRTSNNKEVRGRSEDESNNVDTQFKEIPTKLDTLWLFPNAAVGVMIYRGTIEAFTDDGSDIDELLIACENRNDKPRDIKHYQDQMSKRIDPEHGYKYALFSSPLIATGMTCGFKQIQDEYDFPLDMLGKANIDEYSDSLKSDALGKISDVRVKIIEQCKAIGIDPTPYIEKIDNPEKTSEQVKIEALMEKMAPGMINDPENIDVFNIDLSVMDEIKAYTEELKVKKTAEAKNQIIDEVVKLKALPDAGLFSDAIAKLEHEISEIDLPPMWPRANIMGELADVREQVKQTEAEIEKLRKIGVDEDRLPTIDIDLEKVEAQLLDAEVRIKETYSVGAHLMGDVRSPHPEKEAELKQEFLRKLQNNEALINGDYACIDLTGMDLQGVDLTGCYLEGVNFTGCDLSNANLSGAILAGANLTDAKLHNTNCKGANIGATNLTRTDFFECNLEKAQLGNSTFIQTKIIDCIIDEMNFIDSSFTDTIFDKTSMKQCNFINPVFNDCHFTGADLTQANFVKPVFTNAKFNNSTLDAANFVEASVNRADFSNAQMVNSRFVGGCELNDCKFDGANISKSCLRENKINNSDFSNALLDEADFSGSDLENSLFVGAKAIRTQFMKANLKDANLTNLNLMEGSLYKAYVVGVCFDKANLYCVNFIDATLGTNKYKGANLDQTILKDWRP